MPFLVASKKTNVTEINWKSTHMVMSGSMPLIPTKMTIKSIRSQNTFNIAIPVNGQNSTKMKAHDYNKSYSAATKSLRLIFIKLIVTGNCDLDKDDPMVEEVKILVSMANCCFNGAKTAAGISLIGEHFLEWLYLTSSAGDKLFGGIQENQYHRN